MNTRQIKVAEKIINDYCQVIQVADTSQYGISDSLLQYSKTQIKQAILTALAELNVDEIDLRESLIHSYLHLAQFIPDELADIKVFHAGTQQEGARIKTSGGRVLCVCALGGSTQEAQSRVYEAVKLINWPGMWFRNDIGHRAVRREQT